MWFTSCQRDGEFVDFLKKAGGGKKEEGTKPPTKKCHNIFDDSAEENKTQGMQRRKPKLSEISTECLGQGVNG